MRGFKRPFLMMLVLVMLGQSLFSQEVKRFHVPEEQFQFAEGLFKRKHFDMAIAEYRNFLGRFTKHKLAPVALFQIIQCQRSQGKDNEMITSINQFQQRWKEHELAAKLYLWKGELLVRKRDYNKAEMCFKKLVFNKDTLTQEAAIYYLAQCQIQLKKVEVAFKNYNKIANKEFDDKHLYRPYALYAVATDAQAKSQFKKAEIGFSKLATSKKIHKQMREECLYRLGENYFMQEGLVDAKDRDKYLQKALKCYVDLLEEFPNGVFAREAAKRRAWVYFSKQDFKKAVLLAKEFEKLFEGFFDYEMVYLQAAALVGIEQYSSALFQFERVLKHEPVPEYYIRLSRYEKAFCLLKVKKYDEAISACSFFVKRFPKAAEVANVYFIEGQSWYYKKNFIAAEKSIRSALRNYSGNWEYYIDSHQLLSDMLLQQKRFAAAALVYRSMVGSKITANSAYRLYQAAECERKANNPKDAIVDLEKLLKDYPKDAEYVHLSMLMLGELYVETGSFLKAEAHVKKMLQSKPKEQGRLKFFLGYIYYEQKKYPQAKTMLEEVIKIEKPGKVVNDSKYYLAGVLLELKEKERALKMFSQLLVLPLSERPNFPAKLLLRLEKMYFNKGELKVSESVCRWLLKHPDQVVVNLASIRFARCLIANGRLAEAEKFLQKMYITIKKEKGELEEITALLGEIYVLSNKPAKAVKLLEDSLDKKNLAIEYRLRCWWGLSKVYYEKKMYKQAMHYTAMAAIFGKDNWYKPRCMFIDFQIRIQLKEQKKAMALWKDIKRNHPDFAIQKASLPEVKKIEEVIDNLQL